MVLLKIECGDDDLFLYEITPVEDLSIAIQQVAAIYNGRLKVYRLCMELEQLASYGTMLPPDMIGLNDEEIEELKLKDIWAEKCIPLGGFLFNKDPLGKRNGQQPNIHMQNVLKNTIYYVRELIDKKLVNQRVPLTLKTIEEALNLIDGAVTFVYPMQLPPHDIIRMELNNTEDLSGTQDSNDIIEPSQAQLWFDGRQLIPGKCISDYTDINSITRSLDDDDEHGYLSSSSAPPSFKRKAYGPKRKAHGPKRKTHGPKYGKYHLGR